ncbi:hypothetical protein FQZ97_1104310 [compost metagenome]
MSTDTAEDVRLRHEVGFPVEGMSAAGIEVCEAFLEQFELVLVIAGLGAVIEFLQQHDVRLFVANDPRHFIEAEGHVCRRRFFIAAGGQVIPEHIALARQVLNVPGHHFQRLAGHQCRRLSITADGQNFLGFGAPGQVVDQQGNQADCNHQAQQGVAQ